MGTFDLNDKDREFAKRTYGLTDKEMLEAEKLYYRSEMSYLMCCKVTKSKRSSN